MTIGKLVWYGALLVYGAGAPAGAQSASLPDSLIGLNRLGEWARAAQLASNYLAANPRDARDLRCRVRASQIWATHRQQLTDLARALVREFDAECAGVPMQAELRDVAQVRAELAASVRPVAIPATSGRPAGGSARADGFWKRADPTTLGVDTSVLRRHHTLCRTTGADACLVVVRGRIVQEWYSPSLRRGAGPQLFAMSTTKSIAGILVGMLIAEGKIRGVDDRVCAYVDAWCTGVRGRVTLRHLLTMTSGLPHMQDSSVGFVANKNEFVLQLVPTREPGSVWAYSNEGAQLLSPILDAAAGEPIQVYASRRLFEPLGMHDTRLHVDPQGHAWTYADMETTPRDLARIGLLMLQRGAWNAEQMVPAAWVDSLSRPSQRLNPRYGFLWWIDPEAGAFAGHGHLDTDVHVMPGTATVVVRMQARPARGVREGTYERAALRLYPMLVRVTASPGPGVR